MSMFDNMMGAYGGIKDMMNADSFTGGTESPMSEIEQALTMNNMDQVPMDPMAGTMMGMPGKVQTEVDEIQKKDPMEEFMKLFNAQGGQPGGYLGQTMSGNSMVGNMAKMFGGM